MAITIPTVDEFTESTVMLVIREISEYICGNNGLVAQINNNDITGFTSNYTNNVLKIDATKGDGSTLPVCNVTIEGGGSSTGNPYPTGVRGTVGADGNITFTITMSSGSPLITTINMNYFASTADLSGLQKQVTGLKLTSSGNTMSINGTNANIVNSVTGTVSGNDLTIGVNGVNSSPITLPTSSGGGITLITDTLENHVIIDSGADTVTIPKSLLIEYIFKDDELLPTGRYRSAVGFVPAQTITNLSGAGTITLGYAKLENETSLAGYLQIKSNSGYSGMGVVITDKNTTPTSINTDKINSDTIAIGSPPYYECYRVYMIG